MTRLPSPIYLDEQGTAAQSNMVLPEKEGLVHLIGFAVLTGVIPVISANDINRLVHGQSLLGG